MSNQLKKWFAVLMAMVLGMPGYGLSTKNITTKAEDESIVIHIENEERHVQVGETVFLLDGVSVEGSGEESYRAVVGDVQEQDSGISLYEEGMEEFVIPGDAAGKTYRVLYKAQSSIDNEEWNDVEGSEKEALLVVEQEENKEEETPQPVTVTLQGKEKEEAEVGEVFSFVHDDNVIMNIPEEDEKDYRIIVTEVNTPENGSYSYKEGDISFIPQKVDEGLTYIIHYGVETSKDGAESFERVEGVSFTKEVTVITVKKVTIQGEEERIILANEEYDFIKDSDLVVKGPKEEENSYRLKVKEVKSPENGSYQYHDGDESFTPKESDEGLVYEVTYVAETSKDETTWEEVEDVQFTQKLTVAVFRAEEVRGPLATEAILCTGQQFNNFVKSWNTGSTIKVKNLVKADVPSDLMTASLRYKYETISDPSSPVKIYMWHDMNAYGQYVDTVYFGTEVPGATIYTNPDARSMFYAMGSNGNLIEKIYDSANPSTPYFFNTSKTVNMSYMFYGTDRSAVSISSASIPFDCTNGNGVGPFGLMNTSSAVNMSNIFSWCTNVDFTGIENWDMHKVTDISGMFNELGNICKIPWDIGNWEFDNLQKVEKFFGMPKKTDSCTSNVEYALNMTNWDLSHADTRLMFYRNDSVPYPEYGNRCITRIKLGSKLVDKNGKVNLPWAMAFGYDENNGDSSHPGMKRAYFDYGGKYNYYPNSKNYNGTWEREDTGQQYWSDFYKNGYDLAVWVTQSVPSAGTQDLADAYPANPTAMSGTYKWGEGYSVTYHGEGKSDIFPYYSSGSISFGTHDSLLLKTYFYTNTESGSTHTVLPNMFVADGMEHDHWDSEQRSDGTTYPVGSTLSLTQNHVLYAHWKAKVYSITYIANGGTLDPGNPSTFKYGDYIEISPPTKSGKYFMGWQITYADGTVEDKIMDSIATNVFKAQDVTLTAVWENARMMTIHGNGGKEHNTWTEDITIPFPDIPMNILFNSPYDNWLSFVFEDYGQYGGSGGKQYVIGGHTYTVVSLKNMSFQWDPNTPDSTFKSATLDSAGSDILTKYRQNDGWFGSVIYQPIPIGTTDIYLHWKPAPKKILVYSNQYMYSIYYTCPNGAPGNTHSGIGYELKNYEGDQWDETSPNVTFSVKGYETGSPNEYVFNDVSSPYILQDFTISVASGSSHTYPTGNLTSYTFTGGFDKDVTITLNWIRAWRIQYMNLDDTPITAPQVLKEADLPYTFRNTYPPHAPWHGFRVIPIGWTLGKYNGGSPDATGIYTSTGNLPTLFQGTWNATQFNTVVPALTLYPMYSVDINNDGIADVFQNKNTLTVSKKQPLSMYTNYSAVFPYDVYLNDVHGNPIKNWKVEDTDGNTYTTDTSGVIHLSLKRDKSLSIKGMLPNMIVRAVETDPKGLTPAYAISYNGTSFTSGSDTGNVTYQDNTPLTFTFRNTDNRTIVPAGIKDTNTRVYVLLGAVLIALAFSIHMLKIRRRA